VLSSPSLVRRSWGREVAPDDTKAPRARTRGTFPPENQRGTRRPLFPGGHPPPYRSYASFSPWLAGKRHKQVPSPLLRLRSGDLLICPPLAPILLGTFRMDHASTRWDPFREDHSWPILGENRSQPICPFWPMHPGVLDLGRPFDTRAFVTGLGLAPETAFP
jgi:hypothetical protein